MQQRVHLLVQSGRHGDEMSIDFGTGLVRDRVCALPHFEDGVRALVVRTMKQARLLTIACKRVGGLCLAGGGLGFPKGLGNILGPVGNM